MSDTKTVPCSICGGSPDEHESRQHAYTTNPGELMTPKQQQEKEQKFRDPAMGQPTRMIPVTLPPASVNPTTTDRLVNLLLDKGVISVNEALHILTGRPL